MPLYYFECQTCKKTVRRVCSPKDLKAPVCCGGSMTRTPRPPTSRCVEVLDNGVMTKRLERLTDAERLYHERAEATKKQRGE